MENATGPVIDDKDHFTASPKAGSALLEPVANSNYGGLNMASDPAQLQQPLGEARISQQPAAAEVDPFAKAIKDSKAGKAKDPGGAPGPGKAGPAEKSEPLIANPALKNLSPEQSQMAAANMAKMMMHGYVRANKYADDKLQISEKQLLKIRTAGKIDMETPIPIEGGMVSFEEFLRTFNQQARGTIVVTPEFQEEVLPLLTNVLAKRGAGLSDEQMLLMLVGQDIAAKGQQFIAMKGMLKSFMDFGLEMTKRNNGGREEAPVVQMRNVPSTPAAPDPPPPPPPPPAPPAADGARPGQPEANYVDPGGTGTDGAIITHDLRQWGSQENQKALAKASKKYGNAGIDAGDPGKRRRVGGPPKKSKR